jgi:hypothetical protein
VGVAGLGDAAATEPLAAGVLRRHQAEVAHELAWVIETVEVTDLGHQPDGADHIDAAQRLQRRDQFHC